MRRENTTVYLMTFVVKAGGIISALLGLIVLVGWYTHSTILIQVFPTFVPMQYNTALGFFLCGIGLLLILFGRHRLAMALGGLAASVGILTLMQYVFGVDLGIDQLLMKHYIMVKTSHPGRMAPNTALSFVLAGAALLVMSWRVRFRQRSLVLGLLGSIVIALSTVALFGYLSGVESAYGWGRLTRMAVHTAAGFAILGVGITAFAWCDSQALEKYIPRWLPIPVAVSVVTATLILWQALIAHEHAQTKHTIESVAFNVKSEISTRMESRILALVRMANRWEVQGEIPGEQWEYNARLYAEHYVGCQRIGWVDPSFHVRWIVPLKGSEAALNLDPSLEEWQQIALEAARDQQVTVTRVIDLVQGGEGFLVYVPILRDDSFDGFLFSVFRVQELLDTILGGITSSEYAISVFDGGEEIYCSTKANWRKDTKWAAKTYIELYGTTWHAQIWPSPKLLGELLSPLPKVTLIAGLLTALLLTAIVRFAQSARNRAKASDLANRMLEIEIVERKRAEERSKQLFVSLEQRARELERSNRELEQFAYVASHDLQEPLRMVTSYTQLLAKRYKGKLDGDADEFIAYAVDGAIRMKGLINDLLAYSRVGTRGNPFKLTDIVLALDNASANLQSIIEESAAVVTHDSLPAVMADETQLTQLFQNLIGNAVKFSGNRPPKIHIGARREDNSWLFSVHDNGIGIDPEYIDRIFVIFQRLHSKTEYPGSGIGLAICKKIVERHGGRIWVESEPDKGSTFYFTIPATGKEQACEMEKAADLLKSS